jgi:DNA-binding HxlR family transcriptional regulator
MPKSAVRQRRSDCPINIALEVLGDSWSLLIVRDLMFKERKTYKDFLEAEEGIASNILAERLKRMESFGVIAKHADPGDARRHVYLLTKRGIDLAPLLVETVLWSARHFKTGAPTAVVEQMTRHRTRFLKSVRDQWATRSLTTCKRRLTGASSQSPR